ncbi:MAG: ATP-binding cassette domain-containing protein [Thermomicrobiales bacterium]
MALVRIEQLHYRYPPFDPNDPDPQSGWTLDDISLEVEAGEFLGILGTTGSGKSTLCLAMTGLVPQQTSGTIRGDVWVDDLNTKRTSVVEIATRVGIVFQDPESNFLGLTVEDEVAFGPENLAIPRSEIRDRLAWALELVGMAQYRERSVARLSGGQKQRVAIASVLAMLPKVLILDDPTAELDPVGTAEVLDVIDAVRERRPETAVVMASGDPVPVLHGANRVAVLDAGQMILHGEPSNVYERSAELLDRGVAMPPLAELAVLLNRRSETNFRFETVDEAAGQLRRYLAV